MCKYVRTYKNNIIINKEVAEKIKVYYEMQKEVEPLIKQVKEELISDMQELAKKDVVSNGICATYVDTYIRNNVDATLLKAEYREVYDKVSRQVEVSPQIKLKVGN